MPIDTSMTNDKKDNKHAIHMIVNRIVEIIKKNSKDCMFVCEFAEYDEYISLCYTLSLLHHYTDYYESHIYAIDEDAEQVCRLAYLALKERNIMKLDINEYNEIDGFELLV